MQYEVPQFIEVEDKIFGPLTWRQFVYLGGGVGMATVMFFTLPFILFLIFGIPLALLAAALSFYPVNNRPFSYFLEALLGYITKPKRYLWRKQQSYVHRENEEQTFLDMNQTPQVVRRSGKDISSLARKLEMEAIQKQQ
jgi:hypothetical protein